MKSEILVKNWFDKWEQGDYRNLPVAENFKHTSPFGTINGKKAYLDMVHKNKDKFLGYTFKVIDAIYEVDKACVRYSAIQGNDFILDVSEWHYIKNDLIEEIVAYYHIGEVREERRLKNPDE